MLKVESLYLLRKRSTPILLNNNREITQMCNERKKLKLEYTEFNKRHIERYLQFVEKDKVIQQFLKFDRCHKLADKYLLAIVFVYFIRAKLTLAEYNRSNFFIALCLAHDMEEDTNTFRNEVIECGTMIANSSGKEIDILDERIKLWSKMDHRALVNFQCCVQVMSFKPDSPLWKRERSPAHVDYFEFKGVCPHCNMRGSDCYTNDLKSTF